MSNMFKVNNKDTRPTPNFVKFTGKHLCQSTIATKWFFTDQLDRERPQQILTNYGHIILKSFELFRLFFEAFRIFLFIWRSMFDHF